MNKCVWFSIFKGSHHGRNLLSIPLCCLDYKINCDLCKYKNECVFKSTFHLFFDSNYTMVYNIVHLWNLRYATLYSSYINFSKTLTKNRYSYELFNTENSELNDKLFSFKTTTLLKSLYNRCFLLTSLYLGEYDKLEEMRNFAHKNNLKIREFVGNIHQKKFEGFTILIYK